MLISTLAECVAETARELDRASFPYTIVGHVGDGNFHVLMLLDPDDEGLWEESERINASLVHRAIGLDGACTGEHGVGLHKMGAWWRSTARARLISCVASSTRSIRTIFSTLGRFFCRTVDMAWYTLVVCVRGGVGTCRCGLKRTESVCEDTH